MHFGLSEAARALRDATAGVLRVEVTAATVRAGWTEDAGSDRRNADRGDGPAVGLVRDAWRKLAATGAVGTLVKEDAGGLGLDETCLVPVLEEAGRSGLPGPVAETMAVAAPMLAEAPRVSRYLDGVLSGEVAVTATLTGAPRRDGGLLVPYGQQADLIVLGAGDGVRLYERDDLPLEACAATDGSRGLARLAAAPDPSAGTLLTEDPAVIDAAWQRGALATAALLNGLSARMLDITVGYVKQREQFGKPIGSFQAIKHALADALVAVEFARPAALAAGWALAGGERDAAAGVSMAKVLAADAAGLVARTAIQCHGAIGYTTEYDLHLFAKRAWALIPAWGSPQWHRDRLAVHLGLTGIPDSEDGH
jgi:alkylation response protein AidB-like acyl-CoA dehydrogenase